MKFFFKQMLTVSVFYLEKQKSFIPKKYFLGCSQYQKKKEKNTGPIFSDGFDLVMPFYDCLLQGKSNKFSFSLCTYGFTK